MNQPTLADKLTAWAALTAQVNALGDEIKQEALALEQTITHGRGRATFNSGRKTYDYERIAGELGATAAERKAFSTVKVDWRAVCAKLASNGQVATLAQDMLKAEHYKQAKPSVTLKLLNK